LKYPCFCWEPDRYIHRKPFAKDCLPVYRSVNFIYLLSVISSTTRIHTPRVFLTGVRDFVGGSILSSLHKAQPDIHITALVRTEADAKILQPAYLNLTPIIGTLSQVALLYSAAVAADFGIHVSRDNIPAVCAMIDGLASSTTRLLCHA
jgi:hypothetical protein